MTTHGGHDSRQRQQTQLTFAGATVKVRAGDSGSEGDFHFPAVEVTLEWSDWSGFLFINVVASPSADRKYTDGGQLIKRK